MVFPPSIPAAAGPGRQLPDPYSCQNSCQIGTRAVRPASRVAWGPAVRSCNPRIALRSGGRQGSPGVPPSGAAAPALGGRRRTAGRAGLSHGHPGRFAAATRPEPAPGGEFTADIVRPDRNGPASGLGTRGGLRTEPPYGAVSRYGAPANLDGQRGAIVAQPRPGFLRDPGPTGSAPGGPGGPGGPGCPGGPTSEILKCSRSVSYRLSGMGEGCGAEGSSWCGRFARPWHLGGLSEPFAPQQTLRTTRRYRSTTSSAHRRHRPRNPMAVAFNNGASVYCHRTGIMPHGLKM